jgi:hypothetical protein
MADLASNNTSCTLHPFKRNRYFYGKLMSVRDFETEQSYINEKRHLLNRMIQGSGIIRGFGDMEIKNENGNIEIAFKTGGVALDCCGNEIVVPGDGKGHPVYEGATQLTAAQLTAGSYFFYLTYNESDSEPVSAAVNPSSCEEKCCSNRKSESFTVIATTQTPTTNTLDCTGVEADLQTNQQLKQWVIDRTDSLPTCDDQTVFLAALNSNLNLAPGSILPAASFVDTNETLKYRAVIYNNQLLSDLLRCHITDPNPHDMMKGIEVTGTRVENQDGYVTLEKNNAITITPDANNHTVTIGETHSGINGNPHNTGHEQLNNVLPADPTNLGDTNIDKHISNQMAATWDKAIYKINGKFPTATGNFTISAGNNITITNAANKVTINSTASGSGLETGLNIFSPTWIHKEKISISEFSSRLVNQQMVLQFQEAIVPGADDTIFNMAIRVPWVENQQGLSFHLSRLEYLNGTVTAHPEDKERTLVFFMDSAASEELMGHLFDYMTFLKGNERTQEIRVIMQVKCDFISDVTGKAVAGHHLLGQGKSGLNLDGKFNLQGGLFESWIDLIPG